MDHSNALPRRIRLDVAGLGVIIYSPSSVLHIVEGEDYLQRRFSDGSAVQEHLQSGTIAAFGTGSPGMFVITSHDGCPSESVLANADLKLRLGIVSDGTVVFRDLYDLLDWSSAFPPDQAVSKAPGIYRLTVISQIPASGILGDEQEVDVYFEHMDHVPALATVGIPMLSQLS